MKAGMPRRLSHRAAMLQWLVVVLALLLFALAAFIALHRMDDDAPGRGRDATSAVTE